MENYSTLAQLSNRDLQDRAAWYRHALAKRYRPQDPAWMAIAQALHVLENYREQRTALEACDFPIDSEG